MNDLWDHWGWLMGTLWGTAGGLWGSSAGIDSPMGRARGLVIGTGRFLLGLSVAFFLLGLVLIAMGRPLGAWLFFLLPGAQGMIAMPVLLVLARRRYREAELRRVQAADLR